MEGICCHNVLLDGSAAAVCHRLHAALVVEIGQIRYPQWHPYT
jgi:hypothetical protein